MSAISEKPASTAGVSSQPEVSATESPVLSPEATKDLSHAYGTGEVFAEGAATAFYEPIREYEGYHRYDPSATWEPDEEKKLVKRLDWKITSWCCFMFFALQIDRSNISGALSDNMLPELGLTTNDYNYGMTIFYVSFILAELPSQMISKKLGPDVWIPIQMVSWSIIAICQCRITGRTTFYLTRALLGLWEGGFIPDVVLYLSYFYKSRELPLRLGFFWGAYISTSIVGAPLTAYLLKLRYITPWSGWRWLFALEGAFTAIIGITSWFYLPPSPTQTKGGFRGKDGWFTEREEIIMVNRILRDDPSKGGMHNRQGLTPSLFLSALKDYDLWPIYVLGMTWSIPAAPTAAYLTLNLKNLGFDTFQTNLLTIPAAMLFLFQLILWTWVSEKVNNRLLIVLMCQFYMLPCVLALELMPAAASPWSWYAASVLLLGFPYIHPILVAMTSRNAGSVQTRTVGTALYNMCVQTSSIISSNIYRTEDSPLYRTGNKILLGLIAWNVVFIIFIKIYYIMRNRSKDKAWNAMSQEAKDHYLATTNDTGGRRLDVRFTH